MKTWIVVAGDPIGGFSFHGPFTNSNMAIEFADAELQDIEWWLAELEPLAWEGLRTYLNDSEEASWKP